MNIDLARKRFSKLTAATVWPLLFAPTQEQLILGAEARLWTERLNKSEWLETMTYPRLCALAEITWSLKSARDFDEFSKRMQTHRQRLDMAWVAYFGAGKAEPKLADASQEPKQAFVTGP